MADLPLRNDPDYWNYNDDATALFFGFGNTTNRAQMGTAANKNGVGLFFETTATSGDSRGVNLRLYFSGTGVSGEALRAYGIINNKTVASGGTVNGAHISLGTNGTSSAVSGAANALRVTLGLGASTNVGGTVSALQVDSDFASDATLATALCAIRLTNTGSGKWPNLLEIPAASNGTIFAAHTTQTMTHSIRIRDASGTAYYIMCCNAATNRS
jgi:hypothetical protein